MSLSERSLRQYEYCQKMLTERYGDLQDYEKVIQSIISAPFSDNTKKFYLICAFKKFAKVAAAEEKSPAAAAAAAYKAAFDKIAQIKQESEKYQKITSKESKNYIEYEVIQKACEDCLNDSAQSLENKILISLYCKLPPVRLDYSRLQFFSSKPKADISGNYIYANNRSGAVVITEHKTAKTEGTLSRELPKDILKLVLQWKRANPGKKYLFNFSENYLSNKIRTLFRKYTGKSASVNTIRHAFISYQRRGDTSLIEKEQLAKMMGHSIAQQELYRRL